MNRDLNDVKPEINHYKLFTESADFIFALHKKYEQTEVIVLKS